MLAQGQAGRAGGRAGQGGGAECKPPDAREDLKSRSPNLGP